VRDPGAEQAEGRVLDRKRRGKTLLVLSSRDLVRDTILCMPAAAVTRRFNVRIPMRDGITLSAGLVLPASLPAPAVVLRTPYGKGGELGAKRAEGFAKGGYAAVFVDVRGRGDSDGTFKPYRNDGPDGADVIAWAAAQDWCSGDVAAYGGSYCARIQWLTALEQPAALRAMVCLVTPGDSFVETPTGLPTPMHLNWLRLVDGRMPQCRDPSRLILPVHPMIMGRWYQ
jgi:predicted acyl esterase